MAGLRETTTRLAKMRREALGKAPPKASTMSEVKVFGPNPAGLRMLSHRPANLADGAPLVVVLHGCTQHAEPFARQGGWLTLADRYGFMVVAAEQTAANNPNRCFNWFDPDQTGRGGGEVASIAAMVGHAVRTEGVDPQRVFVTGLSAGGAMAAAMLASYPDLFAAGAIVAGLPYGVARSVAEAFMVMRGVGEPSADELGALVRNAAPAGGHVPRVSIWQGDADYTVDSENSTALLRQWAAAHGVSADAAVVEASPGRIRTVLRAPGSDVVLVEVNLIHGLGHGVPLATLGAEGLGAAAPYMLEAGVSSSLEIARFWGIAPPAETATSAVTTVGAPPRPAPALSLGDHVMASLSPHVPAAAQEVIAKALKTAGLKG